MLQMTSSVFPSSFFLFFSFCSWKETGLCIQAPLQTGSTIIFSDMYLKAETGQETWARKTHFVGTGISRNSLGVNRSGVEKTILIKLNCTSLLNLSFLEQ